MGGAWYSGTMFGLEQFKLVKGLLRENQHEVETDNWLFRMYTKWSFIVTFISWVIVACPPMFLNKVTIACFGPHPNEVPRDFLDHYCFIRGTYIVPEKIYGRIGKDIPHRGIGPDDDTTTRIYQLQYLWYRYVLFLQFSLFQFPKNLWRTFENGRMRLLLSELTKAIVDDVKLKKRAILVAEYMTASNPHITYAYRFIVCEVINVVIYVAQMWLLDTLFDGRFLGFGSNAVRFISSLENTNDYRVQPVVEDPFTKMFPKLTICQVDISGPSGNIVNHQALCVMPINNLAGKVFFVMWFWLVFLGCITILGVIYRVAVVSSKRLRYVVMRLRIRKSVCEPQKLKYLVDNFDYGDWFVFSLIQKNTDVWVFSQLFDELYEKMKETRRKEE